MDAVVASLDPATRLRLAAIPTGASLPLVHRLGMDDGRIACVAEYGARGGQPLIALHGTPGSRLMFEAAGGCAARLGIRLICPDRWGYGHSEPPSAPRLEDYAADIRAIADGLGIGRFSIVGISGGGPFAAAAAAALGDRVARLALVSPVGPVAAVASVRLRTFHRFAFQVLPRNPRAAAVVFSIYRSLLRLAPSTAILLASSASIAVDRRLMRCPLVRSRLSRSFAAGLEASVAGPVIDLMLFGRAWDIDLGGIGAASRIWHGTLDRNVPAPAVEVLAAAIPDCVLQHCEGHGHFWVTRHYDEVLDWVAAAPVRSLQPAKAAV